MVTGLAGSVSCPAAVSPLGCAVVSEPAPQPAASRAVPPAAAIAANDLRVSGAWAAGWPDGGTARGLRAGVRCGRGCFMTVLSDGHGRCGGRHSPAGLPAAVPSGLPAADPDPVPAADPDPVPAADPDPVPDP